MVTTMYKKHIYGSATQTFDDDATGSIECMMV